MNSIQTFATTAHRFVIFAITLILLAFSADLGIAQPASPKRVLYVIGGNKLNQVDNMLIRGLRDQGVEVQTLSNNIGGFKYKVSSEIITETQSSPAAPPNKSKVTDPSNPPFSADYQIAGNWNDSLLANFDCIILNDCATVATSNHAIPLPYKDILRSSKLIVYGEARSVADGETTIRTGKVTSKGGQVKPYTLDSSMHGISYIVFDHTWQRGMKLPTDAATEEFITKSLVPKIKSSL